MNQDVRLEIRDGIATIAINNPPVNALGASVRRGLAKAIDQANSDPLVHAIVIHALGRTFPVGADIREFAKPFSPPGLPALCDQIESVGKPVVAALHGTALGGGLEIALAAHYRIADPAALIGLPEVALGLLPGAGGTQRTARICGAALALELMLSGKQVSVALGVDMGLIDRLSEGDLLGEAVDYARSLPAGAEGCRPTRARREGFKDVQGYVDAVAARRAEFATSPLMAPGKIIDCVEAAILLPFEAGLAFERAAFEDCLQSDQSAALRHAFFAERRAAKVPELDIAEARNIESVGVVGGGTMGSGISVALLNAGYRVVMIERDKEALAVGLARVSASFQRAVTSGRLTAEQKIEREERLTGDTQYGVLAASDLVIEAVVEDLAVKEEVFARLDAVLKEGAILASNTSFLDIDALATGVSRPQDVIGLHFFSPAHVMTLLEVIVADATLPDVVASGFALAKRLGKIAVRSGVTDGFIGNSILSAYRHATDLLLEEGASPYQVDRAMRDYGFALGPYQVLDLAGLDISWARRKRLAPARDPGARYVSIGDKLCEAGWLGQKTGRGYYRYPEGGRKGVEDVEVLALIEAERGVKGVVARTVSDAEIRARALAAMVNEGAHLLERGVALRPSDIDTVMIHGYGFARWRGGPMKAPDLTGLLAMRNRLQDYYAQSGDSFWAPAALFDDLIKNGHDFDALNQD
ncbi:MAG: 3-hydroxyacyl-CoA dehydrogenase NAD-binding domain-containing protein [Halocynthiibacter sp.]